MAGMRAIPIVALDVSSAAAALAFVDRLGDSCTFYKIGSELFTREGPAVVQAVRDRGRDVFLDLKFHDIPNTVRQAAAVAASLGVRLITVHASGGRQMLEEAVAGAGTGCGVLAVTVLTSLDADTLGAIWGRERVDVAAQVLRLADLAKSAGAHGIVCSGHEVEAVRARHGKVLKTLVPGIRLAGGEGHDQARVMTPDAAVKAGADYLVLGRVVTEAADPAAVMQEVNRTLR